MGSGKGGWDFESYYHETPCKFPRSVKSSEELSAYKHWGQTRSICERLEIAGSSPMCSGEPLHQDSFSLLPLLKAQDSPCSPSTIPSARNTIWEKPPSLPLCTGVWQGWFTQVTLSTCLLEHCEELESLNISSWGWEMCLKLFICLVLFFCLFPAFRACEVPVPGVSSGITATKPPGRAALLGTAGQAAGLTLLTRAQPHSWLFSQLVVMLMWKAIYVSCLSGALYVPPWFVV